MYKTSSFFFAFIMLCTKLGMQKGDVETSSLIFADAFQQHLPAAVMNKHPFRSSSSSVIKRGTMQPTNANSKSSISMNLFEDLLTNLSKNSSRPQAPKVRVPEGFTVPEPKPLSLTESSDLPAILKSSIALGLRLATTAFVLGWKIDSLFYKNNNDDADEEQNLYSLPLLGGVFNIRDSSSVLDSAPRPPKPLILYEYDSSPYCKRVREIINILDLTVEYRPCPGARQSSFSQQLKEMTGRQTIPYLMDPNTDVAMFESSDIINYLVSTYGPMDESLYDKKALWPVTWEAFSVFTSTLAAVVSGLPASQRQSNARSDNEQMIPLELWGYECSPFVKPVREKLCSLALPHLMISCSRGSKNRDKLVAKTGRFQVPFLVDPNTGIEMFESAEICQYLDAVYTVEE
jgi:glutathione S-transferase